jgi:ectoine hydroxylase-related dioxygenase (phytanoyl-CoA dioxygenase family)
LLCVNESFDLGPALAHFHEHGYASLGRVMSDDALAALRERTDDMMLGRVTYPGLFFQKDTDTGSYDDLVFGRGYEGPSLNYRKIEKLEKDELFLRWIENPLFERISRAMIDGAIVIYRAVLMNKGSRGGTVLPWHQDGGRFWGLDRDPMLQIWTALDDAPEEAGCVEVVPGSHKLGLATPLGGVVPDNHVEQREANQRARPVPAHAGEAILIHNHVLHRSLVNRTSSPRRAISICYMSANTRCTRKKHRPRTFFRVFDRSGPRPPR